MKIRIKGNTLRLRLAPAEVEEIAKEGLVSDKIDFGSNQLIYSLESTQEATMSADFNGSFITVRVPNTIIDSWTSTDQVGFNYDIPLGDDKSLSVLVEKDFQCLKPRAGEDESKLYKNPLAE